MSRPKPALSALSFALALGLTGACVPAEGAAGAKAQRPDRFYDRLDAEDLKLAGLTLQRSLETKASNDGLNWGNPKTGNGGAFVPLRTFRLRGGYFCREYSEKLVAGQAVATRRVIACRREDGRWIPALR